MLALCHRTADQLAARVCKRVYKGGSLVDRGMRTHMIRLGVRPSRLVQMGGGGNQVNKWGERGKVNQS